ncbi:MAG: N-methyl-L-tryptophan oxidase [Betaproteobacteria bacterium]|nr:N-methyl-L-tryptophan oxidase [Betaproteobacteria bacterium]
MDTPYDAIVLGLGAMGSATLYQLAKRGGRVLGIDRLSPPHDRGSSHGDTRITRLAIGEGEPYTPLAIRSHEIWREIEAETGMDLLTTTGGLIISGAGPRAACHVPGFFENTLAAASSHGIRHDLLDASDIRRRFPQFAVRDDEVGYYEYEAGFLRPEACVTAQLKLAEHFGAVIHCNERALRFTEEKGLVRLWTEQGSYEARRLVVTAGPWLPQLLGETWAGRFTVRRQVLYWFAMKGPVEAFQPERFPVFIWELANHAQPIYGFPAIEGPDGGVKIATEQHELATTPETVARGVDPGEATQMFEEKVAPYFPALSGDCVKAVTCLYTMTADCHFVIEAHPDCPDVIVASPCSGHGFKHSAAIGERLARLVIGDEPAVF